MTPDEYRALVLRAKLELRDSIEDSVVTKHRRRIASNLERLSDAPPEPDGDHFDQGKARDIRDAEAKRRQRREIASENDDVRGGIADMYGFVRSIEAGFVPDAALLRSIARRFTGVLTDATDLLDGHALDRMPRDWRQHDVARRFDKRTFEYVPKVRPATPNLETGGAFLDRFDMRQPGGAKPDLGLERWGREKDWRYWALRRREPGIKQEAAFAQLAERDRDAEVESVAYDELEAMFPVPSYDDSDVEGFLAENRKASRGREAGYSTLHRLLRGKAVEVVSDDELWRSGQEAAPEALRRAEEKVPKPDPIAQGRNDIKRWSRWLKEQPQPTYAEQCAPFFKPIPRKPSRKAGTEECDSDKGER